MTVAFVFLFYQLVFFSDYTEKAMFLKRFPNWRLYKISFLLSNEYVQSCTSCYFPNESGVPVYFLDFISRSISDLYVLSGLMRTSCILFNIAASWLPPSLPLYNSFCLRFTIFDPVFTFSMSISSRFTLINCHINWLQITILSVLSSFLWNWTFPYLVHHLHQWDLAVIWPTTSCSVDWLRSDHVTFTIIEW